MLRDEVFFPSFLLHHEEIRILVTQPGIEHMPPVLTTEIPGDEYFPVSQMEKLRFKQIELLA